MNRTVSIVIVAAARLLQSRRAGRLLALAACAGTGLVAQSRADLVLETETAQLGKAGTFAMSVGMQFERAHDGSRTVFTLNQFEYAITDRMEILIEPFFYEWDNPHEGSSFSGIGDVEITPSYMIHEETPDSIAVVLAFKLKVPTASNRDIGTGKYDYQPYVILGKTFDSWIINANLGVDFVTSPDGESLRNQFIYDLSVERIMTEKWSVFAEVFGNSSPAAGERNTFAGALATEYKISENFNVFISVGYDTDRMANVRVGCNFEF